MDKGEANAERGYPGPMRGGSRAKRLPKKELMIYLISKKKHKRQLKYFLS